MTKQDTSMMRIQICHVDKIADIVCKNDPALSSCPKKLVFITCILGQPRLWRTGNIMIAF